MELPKAMESEQAVLGAMIAYPSVASEVVDLLKSEDFYYTNHIKIYREIVNLYSEGLVIDTITLAQSLNNKGLIEEVGGASYLSDLSLGATFSENIKYHCNIIKDKWTKRNIINISRELMKKAYDTKSVARNIISEGAEELYKICSDNGKMYTMAECLDSALVEIEKRYNSKGESLGKTTGFVSFDKAIGGLQKGNLFIIAGRPSMGKTALALNIACKAAKKSRVAIFSFEMSKQELTDRLLSDEVSVKLGKIKSGKLSSDEFEQISNGAACLSERYAIVYDGRALNTSEIRSKCMKAKLQDGLDIVVIDYLQLINGDSKSSGNRVYEISKISRELKSMARELEINIIALSQLSRATEGREDKRPVLSDLRDSGAIEQDADIIALLYRDEYYNRDSNEKGICEILIGKNRNGKTGMFKLNWIPEIQRFVDI
ncbi:replicative DNA helicase [Clostridium gasigenes]|uniref:replicative DNA helicase n=1 Tax=Clostridium gasigenes TaxID=94869 RepID=UPI0014386162|nr:replicative DNA helicase [Clostridium gasigenes]MBU3104413.1 replicative DNA helicase [Clostridium gasigenes]MBU3136953.1 replicative DNA helicase [Clostridium gasigenes]NKF06733.1 replicative DNA helicase [Clostridium gasigenes]QSW20920.1 replicative DNA helicase [Clostridium gasigenes]